MTEPRPARRFRRYLRQLRRLRQQGRLETVRRQARRVLVHCASQTEAWYLLGRVAEASQSWTQALVNYQRVLYYQPHHSASWYRLAQIYAQQEQPLPASQALAQYLKHTQQPSAQAYLQLAQQLSRAGQQAAALPCYLRALELGCTELALYLSLFQTLESLGDLTLALDCLISLGQTYPTHLAWVAMMMGYVLEKKGDHAGALSCYDQALQREPQHILWHLKRAMTYPRIAASRSEIEAGRAQMQRALNQTLKQLKQQALRISGQDLIFLSMLHFNALYLAYHHENSLPLHRLLAQIMQRVLKPPAPLGPQRHASERIQLGIILDPQSMGLVYLLAVAMAEQLNPARFQVHLFTWGAQWHAPLRPSEKPGLQHHLLSDNLYTALEQVRAVQVDVAFFTEPSRDFKQYLLALFRVAAVQCTSWINPGSSGLASLDYFLSSALFEPAQAQRHYSETLESWPTIPSWFPSVTFPPAPSRADFGLQADWHLLACLQNVLKFHPDFDWMLAEILRQDPQAHLLLVADAGQELAQALSQRWQSQMPELMQRIWIFPALSPEHFLNLIQISDVGLDPLYYGGGSTNYRLFAWGLPLVTLPTPSMTGQITAAFCRLLDYPEGIVDSPAAYVAKALELARQPALCQQLQAHLRQRAQRLFEDPLAVTCFADFLQRAVAASG